MRDLIGLGMLIGVLVGAASPARGEAGGPVPVALAGVAAQDCRAAGCRFDGLAHPLRLEPTFRGQATAGWSLEQWRAVLPAATALDDEVDGLVVQDLADRDPAPGAQAAIVRLPAGKGWSSHPITTCARSLRLLGEGSGNSVLAFRPGVDGFHHCTGRRTQVPGTGLDLGHLALTTAGLGSAAIDATFGYGGVVPMQMNDVGFRGDDEAGGRQAWATCGDLRNPGGMILRDVTCTGLLRAPLDGVRDGFAIASLAIDGNRSAPVFDMQFYGVNINGYNTCLDFHSTTDQGIEGVVLHGLQCGGVNRCIGIRTDVQTYYPPQYFFDRVECETAAEILRVDGAGYLTLSDSLFYINEQSERTGRIGPADLFHLNRLSGAFIHHNAIEALPGSVMHTVAGLTGSTDVRFDATLVKLDTGATVAEAGFLVPYGMGNTRHAEADTRFLGWPADKPKALDRSADPTNVFASAWAGGVPFARLPVPGNPDRPSILCTDCRKPGEGPGRGTGLRVDDLGGGRWFGTDGRPAAP